MCDICMQLWINTGLWLGDQPTEEENALKAKEDAEMIKKTGHYDPQGEAQIEWREY